MRKEISTQVVVAVIVVLLVVVGYLGYRMVFASPQQSMTPEQQKESMRHMIKH